MIVITGATGHLGSLIIDRLLQLVPADTLGVSVRDADKALTLAQRGVRVRAGDFTRPRSLEQAFEGAEQVLIVSAAIRGDAAAEANKAAIAAAKSAGASRILYTSHQAASPDSVFGPQPVHAATEAFLAAQDVPFTALRNGFYASALGIHLDSARSTGRIIAPEDGPVSWTAHEDLAEAAAAALTDAGALDGITAPLTASAALDLEQIASILSTLTGRTITRVTVSDDEWMAQASERGLPPAAAEFALGMYRAARRGEFAVTDPALADILGHEPTPVSTTLARLMA